MRYVTALALLLAGCAASPQSEAERVYDDYRGKPVLRLMQVWGTPSRHVDNPIGRKYIWVDQPIARNCQMEVQADEFEHVDGIHFAGNDLACAAMLRMVKHQ